MPLTMNGTMATLADQLGAVADTLTGGQAQTILEDAAQPVLEQMRQNASSDPRPKSGRLRSAINTGNATNAGGRLSITIGIHKKDWSGDDYYPAYVEFGHGGPRPAPPHPFIRPAIDSAGEESMNRLVDALSRLIK